MRQIKQPAWVIDNSPLLMPIMPTHRGNWAACEFTPGCLQHLLVHRPPGQREISAGDVQHALDSQAMRERMAGWHSEKMDRLVVFASIDLDRFTYADVLQRLQQAGATVDSNALDMSLQRLELGFVLGKQANTYFYRVPLFREMVLADDPQMHLQAELA